MPEITPIAGGYEQKDLIDIVNRLSVASEALREGVGLNICRWLNEEPLWAGTRLRILSVFAGGGANEIGIATADNVAQLVLSDGEAASEESMRETVAELAKDYPVLNSRVSFRQLRFPLETVPEDLEPFHAITCLGVSFFHLRDSEARLQCLRQLWQMLLPGGYLFVDNKAWTEDLREARDPMTIYDLLDGTFLATTYEYPEVGIQLYHVQLMEQAAPDKRTQGESVKLSIKDKKRYLLTGYPVQSATLVDEMKTAGFIEGSVVPRNTWPSNAELTPKTYYHMVIARKPEA